MAGRSRKITDRQIEAALRLSGGIVSYAAKILHCSRQTIYNRFSTSVKLRKYYEDLNEDNLDFVEMKLFELIKDGNVRAIIFFLRNKGADRGYRNRDLVIDLNNLYLTDYQIERLENGDSLKDVCLGPIFNPRGKFISKADPPTFNPL